ncbi:nucleoside 2-deoxyribosyltransferase [Rhizobium sp. AAP43]|uniref:nucleoside 2-deoxyribosyltransferase n=1 Tax=Rhizobium sp. AAP43 TaxID=1523420 RepID=UPI0006B98704|nr:nucleoside 2-deoxyribosyltransferase [Rhizobium sp. AAP43]KPF42290.1 nucleoside 2-deoxyribosyltransferase [Rhizobium sp. AAP43]
MSSSATPLKLYLAGPEVFLPDARAILDAKAALTRTYGFEPICPGDLVIPPAPTKHQFGLNISEVDEGFMNAADGVIANLTPFRGIAADPGTVFELGYMCGAGKRVACYTNVAASHYDRSVGFYNGKVHIADDGRKRAPDGTMLEDFEMIENLMLHGGVTRRGGPVAVHDAAPDRLWTDLTGFEQCLKALAEGK